MDIKNPAQKFNDELDKVLNNQPANTNGLLPEEAELLRLARALKKSAVTEAPAENFQVNLRKRLLNEAETFLTASSKRVPLPELSASEPKGLLARPRRRWAWAAVPLAVVAFLAVYSSIALASPGFYEKYVPGAVKDILSDSALIKTGGVAINSDPAGATIYINDRQKGKTPTEISDLRVGRHRLKIKKEGFVDWQEEIEIEAGIIKQIQADLAVAPVISGENKDSGSAGLELSAGQLVGFSEALMAFEINNPLATETAAIASFTKKISRPTLGGNGNIFYVYSEDNKIACLFPSGKQEILTEFSGEIIGPIVATSDGATLFWVGKAEGQAVVFSTDVAKKQTQKISDVPEKNSETSLVGTASGWVYYAVTAGANAAVADLGIINLADGTDIRLPLPMAGVSGSFVIAPDSTRILYKNISGQPVIFNSEKDFQLEIDLTADYLAWVGDSKVAISVGTKVFLVDLGSPEPTEIFSGSEKINNLVTDKKGRTVAFAAGGKIYKYDVTGGSVQEIIGDSDSALLGFVPAGTWSAGERLYAPDSREAESDPLALMGRLDLPAATFEDIALAGDYAYRVSNGANSLEVISLTDPQKPGVIATLPARGFYKDIKVGLSGNKLVAVGGRLVVFDVTNPDRPKKIYDADNDATQVVTAGETAYVVAGSKLRAYDIATEPVLLGEISLPVTAYDLEYHSGKVYVAGGDGGFVVVDVSNPRELKIVQTEGRGFVRQVAVAGDYVYAVAGVPGGGGEVFVYNKNSGGHVRDISPAFTVSDIITSGNKIYSHYPRVEIYQVNEAGEVILLKQGLENAIIQGVGDMDVVENKIIILLQSNIFVFSTN
jgi:hypothetical protein